MVHCSSAPQSSLVEQLAGAPKKEPSKQPLERKVASAMATT
jgi:hypothetical protein